MNTNIVIGVIIIVMVVIGAISLGMSESAPQNQTNTSAGEQVTPAAESEAMMDDMSETDMMDEVDMMDEEVETESAETDSAVTSNATFASAGSYETYSADKIARAEEGDVVLFFRASWCPSCRALERDIRENAADIPAGVTILEVDYDTSTELRQRYGVTTQHTLVQVDANGNEITKWLGGNTLDAVVAEII